jgi:phenylacetic acid degradation operon negative regulatory protein
LLRTVIGLYMREAGGWMATKDMVVLMEALGTSGTVTRTALGRLRKKEMLVPESRGGLPGFTLTAGAASMLARGDRRIFTPRTMAPTDPWCLVSFSIPETERDKRHQLRRRLYWIGCGTVAAGLLKESAAKWWDLAALAQLHRDFIREHAAAVSGQGGRVAVEPSADAFATYVRSIDRWRIIPYLDPGLPASFLPEDWPGADAAGLFARIGELYAVPSARFVGNLMGVSVK